MTRWWTAAAVLCVAAAAQAQPVTAIIVRHAEREAVAGNDPPISAAGRARAELLANMLRDEQFSAVFASELQRTQQTVEPVAARLGIETTIVPANDTAGLRKRILAQKGKTVLVAGHSNTVPALISALGGPGGITIPETEFDRLYILAVPSRGKPMLTSLRYGAPPAGPSAMGTPVPIRSFEFTRSGGVAGAKPVTGRLELTGEEWTVTEPGGTYRRNVRKEEIEPWIRRVNGERLAALVSLIEPRGADAYQYDVTLERGDGRSFLIRTSELAAGEVAAKMPEAGRLLEWVQRESDAIASARRAR
ncbi:MAG: histidine phosphatase family protein [Bryobacteraceae bacterium]|nr:histidine phosphatase family protein [Bryobacteraceae bacterium]